VSLTLEQEETQNAVEFWKSIMVDYEEIPNSNGMSVLRNVVELETGMRGNIVIRNSEESFWQACIKTLNTPSKRYRVCAVGTPGTGKTALTTILICMLVKDRQTVVYLIRTDEKAGWYYEFTPDKESAHITAKVYCERNCYQDIASLRDPSTYYVVE
jgi:hypothetical protein